MQAQVVTCACGDYQIEHRPLTREGTTWRTMVRWRRPDGSWVFVGDYDDPNEATDAVARDGHGFDQCR